jgi:hypothetical protein
MIEQLRNMKLSELEVREDLNFLEREWVIGRLVSKTGVHEALSRPDDPHRLVVEYDGDLVNANDLLEFLQLCGLHANVTPLHEAETGRACA